MSATRGGPSDHAAEISPKARDMLGRIRRMVVSVTARALWQVVGHKLFDGTTETRDAEVFSGIGFYSRPPSSGKPEAIVVFPGGAGNPIVAATRDEKTRQAIAGELAEGETAVYNASAIVFLRANGTIEIRSAGGTAQALATKADLDALIAAFNAHVHVYIPGTLATVPTAVPTTPASSSTGTTKLRGE